MSAKETGNPGRSEAVSSESIAKMTKEIVVKFIEVGKLSPANFDETFAQVFHAIERTVRK